MRSALFPEQVNIPYEDALENGSMKREEQLQEIFSGLEKDRAVEVYTNVGIEAAIIWFCPGALGI